MPEITLRNGDKVQSIVSESDFQVKTIAYRKEDGQPYNCYLVEAGDEALLIDLPLRDDIGWARIEKELGGRKSKISLAFTHLHNDDFSEKPSFLSPECRTYVGKEEMHALQSGIQNFNKQELFLKGGFPEEEMLMQDRRTEIREKPDIGFNMSLLSDGDVIRLGKEELICLFTPGHTRGHLCFYYPKKEWLFSGDIVPLSEQPAIDVWAYGDSAIDRLLFSLDKLSKIPVSRFYPTHGQRKAEIDFQGRTGDIKDRFFLRILELYQLIYAQPGLHAYDLSPYFLHLQDIWGQLPVRMKWEAISETLAFLEFLRVREYVRTEERDGKIYNFPGKRQLTDSY